MECGRDNFRFTLSGRCLTQEQRKFYEKNGYVVFRKLVPQDIIDKCHRRFEDIVSGKASRDGITVMYDVKDRKSVNKLQEINRDEVFREYIELKTILDIVESFTGPNIMAVHSMLIAKPPDIGFGTSKHPPHQDLYYFPFRPADRLVASWTAMEPCTRENGCLFVAPGSHLLEKLFVHDYPPNTDSQSVNKFYHGIQDLPESLNWAHLEMEPGDTVFFHPLLIHGSGVNTTNKSRRSISCHYASSECYYIDVNQSVQKRIQDEILQYLKRRFPEIDISYKDVWAYKSTLVRGIRSSL